MIRNYYNTILSGWQHKALKHFLTNRRLACISLYVKQTNKFLQNRAFTYYVKDYDVRNKVYTLVNPITKDTKRISKEEFDKMHHEQGGKK